MVRLSTSAAKEIQRLRSKQHNQNVFFRLKVQTGGCSSLLYHMEFDTYIAPNDCVYDCNGMTVVVDAQSVDYIHDLLLDYSEDLMGGGFRFHNPQAIATCSCGNSFSVASDAPRTHL